MTILPSWKRNLLRVIDCSLGRVAGSSENALPTPSVRRCSSMTTRVTPLRSAIDAQLGDLDEILERLGQRAEAVAHAGHDFVDFRHRARRGQLLVDGDLLRDLRNVIVGHERVELDVDDRFALGFAFGDASLCARRSLRPAAARRSRNRPAPMKPDCAAPSRLPAPRISRSRIAICRPDPEMGELANRFEPRLGIFGQRLVRLIEQIRIRLMVRAPDASAQLIELREAELVGVVDDDRVDVGDVDPVLDDRRRRRRRRCSPSMNFAITGSSSVSVIWPWPTAMRALGTSCSSARATA